MSGTEMQRAKEAAAEIMRQKQVAGTPILSLLVLAHPNSRCPLAPATG